MASSSSSLEQRKEEIFEELRNDKTVVLVGEHGIGKTWMARETSDRALKENLFTKTLWVFLNRKYNSRSLHESIASQLSLVSATVEWEVEDDNGETEKKYLEDLKQKISSTLARYKCLLVLDGEGNKMTDAERSELKTLLVSSCCLLITTTNSISNIFKDQSTVIEAPLMAASSSMFVNPANIQSLVTVKLTKDNYLLWKTQVVPYLRGQRLFGFVDGSNPPPPITIPNPETATSSDTTAEIPNPKFTTWYLQDQVVLSTLVSSLSEGILAQMVGLTTSREVWLSLEKLFSTHSTVRAIQTRQFMATTKKGNLSIFEYFQKMKSFADTLAAIGQPLLDQEFTAYLLGGLDTTYDAIVTSISTRIDQMPTEEMFSHLLNFELRLEQHNSTLEATIGSAIVAT
ncbi:hypothetical protein F0562_018986 [Nyssa sinensis]|uniref:NB-ARC domain-containing protein n=1 Tax=Nyssa sinensis TaxID=561372 RepID=A0A5J4Z9H5_9ASTE|nr:hypothetical protein F0562_018986 [Nyssa sinensis]